MDVTLQKHEAKHIYKVPEGLRELCTDISREVLRSQPENLYEFIAEYVDTLLITRENTKIAVKVVNNILLGSQAILCLLYRSGFTLEQITVAAPRIQKAFREYLDAVDMQPVQICEDHTCDEKSKISIRTILEATGSTREDAERASTIIQAAFRGHYERIALHEAQGKVQWQRAVINTMDILKTAGASQAAISKAARHVKFAYRGYYTRRNQKIDAPGQQVCEKEDTRILEPAEAIQAVAWLEMMYKDSGLTVEMANEAAAIIQRAYKKYRTKRGCYDVQRMESTKSMVVGAVIDTLYVKIFEKVISRGDIPAEYGSKEEMVATSTKLQVAFKEHVRMARISKEGYLEAGEIDGEELLEDEETEEVVTTEHMLDSEFDPQESEVRTETEQVEEQSTEMESDEQQTSEAEVTTEHLPTSPEFQSELETEYPTELELDEEGEEAVQEMKENEEHEHEKEEEEPNVAQETGTTGDAVE